MSSSLAIKVDELSKCYHIYDKPRDRLMQMLSRGKKQFFREFWALRNVSFSINKGETVGIIGRNGSGKSTLLQMICGTVTPTYGTVSAYGRVAALLELGAGFNPEFTGRENIFMNAAILGFPHEEMAARMQDVLAFSELGDFLDQPVKTYSSGMYARLAFSIAINVDPEILIIDEALAVGDARFVAKCMRRIKDIQEKGATILFVSHDVASVRTLCERAIWLDHGNMVEDGDVFPVSGRFMEFMFSDEKSDKESLNGETREEVDHLEGQTGSDVAAKGLSTKSGESGAEPVISAPSLDSRPVTHWGSRKGLILSAAVCDESGIARDVHSWGKPLNIAIELDIAPDIPREHLSIAFSIKDLKGTDLIVSATDDQEVASLPESGRFKMVFRLTNYLVTGKYLLVAAVENRQYRDIHYYEYVEGAHYFSSVSNERFFGLFQPSIEQEVLVK
ncbi:ABC transporter ATP-binding protein [Noviherbaspirillum sp. 1P10PC]|uniref:ABC transporter ATP-binding protein n=1 Tax=Noviherbaspirillum sp. 1P10PC TaxID=3132292 RepID=UPI0039A38BC0